MSPIAKDLPIRPRCTFDSDYPAGLDSPIRHNRDIARPDDAGAIEESGRNRQAPTIYSRHRGGTTGTEAG